MLRWIIALIGVLAVLPAAAVGNDRFVAGGSPRIDEPVSGDLFAVGGNVDVEAPVAGDAALMGGNLRIGAPVGGSVFAAGGRLQVDAAVGRNLRVGGGQVDLGPQGSVGGNVTAAGGQLTLRGAVKGSVIAGGGRIVIDGPVDGDVESGAGSLRLGPNARIGGKLRYRSGGEIDRHPAAQVSGEVERLTPRRAAGERQVQVVETRWSGPGWFWTIGLMALAALLVAVAPEPALRVAALWRERPLPSLGWGFAVLAGGPVAVLILVLTIIGIPIAIVAALAYAIALMVGYVASGVALGQWGLGRWRGADAGRTGWRVAAAVAAAVLVIALAGSVPFIGGWVVLLAVLLGTGAVVQLALRRPAATG